jgi:two-component system sensor histidine kinase BaeS
MRRRLFAWLALAALVATALTTVTALVLERRAARDELRSNVRRQAAVIADALVAAPRLRVFLPNPRGRLVDPVDRPLSRPEMRERGLRLRGALERDGRRQGEVDLDGRRWVFARDGQFAVARPARERDALGSALGVLILAGLGSAIVAAVVAALATRGLTRPLGDLAAAARRLAGGDRRARVEERGPDELVDVARAFNGMAAELQAAREAERRFLLAIGHELKTPLTAVRAHAEALEDAAVAPGDAARVIGAESARLERLVADLLDLAAVGQRSFALRRQPVALAAVAEEAVRRHADAARERGVDLRPEASAAGTALADPDRVLQAVSNLVDNATRVTPPGGRVTIEATGARIAVRDTGPGLPDEDLPRAFERFYLHARHGADGPGGTGVGLAIVRELAEAMGGSVAARRNGGRGTEFVLTLPAAAVDP